MKKQLIPGMVMLAFSLIITIGSVTFLGPCVHEDGTAGACHWAGRAVLGLGCLLAAVSLITLLPGRARFGAFLSGLAVCAAGMLTPGTLIDLCRMSSMRCRAVMQPAMILLFAAAGIASAAGALCCRKGQKGNR